MKNIENEYDLQHLNPKNILDRGHPLLKIVLVALALTFIGLLAPILNILAWIGGLILFFIFAPIVVWLYLKLK